MQRWHGWDDYNQEPTGEIARPLVVGMAHQMWVYSRETPMSEFRKTTKAREPDGPETWEETEQAATLAVAHGGTPGDVLTTGRRFRPAEESVQAPALTKNVGRYSGGHSSIDQAILAVGESTSSTEGSPARTSASPGGARASRASARGSSSSSPESPTLFDHDGCSSRTYPDYSPRTAVGTSESYWTRWPSSGTASRGECSTHATSEFPRGAVECSLSDVLEETVPPRYGLSAKAAAGVLRRARVRGRRLPYALERALKETAQTLPAPSPDGTPEPAPAATE